MATDLIHWIKVADCVHDIQFAPNGIAEVKADGRKICLTKFREQLFAFVPTCPHAGGSFINGYIDPLGNVVCPLHGYKFCPRTGYNVSGEGYHLKHWPVVVQEDGVFVGFEAKKGQSFF